MLGLPGNKASCIYWLGQLPHTSGEYTVWMDAHRNNLPWEVHEIEGKVVGLCERIQVDIVVLEQIFTAEWPQGCHDGWRLIHFTENGKRGGRGESLMIISCKTYPFAERERVFRSCCYLKVVTMLLQQHSHQFGGHTLAGKHCVLLIWSDLHSLSLCKGVQPM